jgi:surface polysaccharide O-acyltransferase-like enzyme
VYIALELGKRVLDGAPMDAGIAWELVWMRLLYGSSFHLWFVYTLLGLYLFIPILRKWLFHATTSEVRYFLVIWAVTLFLEIPAVLPWVNSIELRYFAGYIGYLVLGHYLVHHSTFRVPSWIHWALLMLGSAATILGTQWLTTRDGHFNDQFHRYLTLNVAFAAIGVFQIIRGMVAPHWLVRIMRSISLHSYGIYLVHVLVLTLMSLAGLKFLWLDLILRIPLLTLVCLAISWCTMGLLHQIPGLRGITG